MDTLNLKKNDLKILLAAAATLPVICFMAGIYVAGSLPGHSSDLAQAPIPSSELSAPSAASQDDLLPPFSEERISGEPAYPEFEAEAVSLTEISPADALPQSPSIIEQTAIHNPALVFKNRYVVQAGLFSQLSNAKLFIDILNRQQLTSQLMEDEVSSSTPRYRVILGAFDTREQAVEFAQQVTDSHDLKLFVTTAGAYIEQKLVASL